MKRIWLITLVLLVGFMVFGAGYAFGLNIYQKTLDAIGAVKFTDEVTISEIEIDDATQVKVKLSPAVGKTQADVNYVVCLLLDGIEAGQQPTSWTAAEITAGTKKKVTFTGLNLVPVATLKVEVTH